MEEQPSHLADWTPEQIELGRRWVQAWKEAARRLSDCDAASCGGWMRNARSRYCAVRQITGFPRGHHGPAPD